MFFLALDAALKKQSETGVLNCDPRSIAGKRNRDQITIEYERLVKVASKGGRLSHVKNLGAVETGGTSPEKRISSNFLTVSLKNATRTAVVSNYPKRPKNCPLMKLGPKATELEWGIMQHESYQNSLPPYLGDRVSITPFLDLAIFILRDERIDPETEDLLEALTNGLRKRFTKPLVDFFGTRINYEIRKVPPKSKPFDESKQDVFSELEWIKVKGKAGTEDDRIKQLKDRVKHLEDLLASNRILFN